MNRTSRLPARVAALACRRLIRLPARAAVAESALPGETGQFGDGLVEGVGDALAEQPPECLVARAGGWDGPAAREAPGAGDARGLAEADGSKMRDTSDPSRGPKYPA
jgi:hypothetical protein